MVYTSVLDLGKDFNLQNMTKQEFVEESVTESKHVLLKAQQVNKSRDEVLGQGITSDFIQKASRLRRWWTGVPKNHLTRVRIQASFILKGRECGWLLQTSWCWNPLFLQLSQRSCKPLTRHRLFSVMQCSSLYELEGVITLKIKTGRQSLENGLSCIFQATGHILSQRCRASMTETGNRARGLELKE